MTLEEAIQQKKFVSVYQKAHLNILYSAACLNQATTRLLKPFGLTWQQFNILRILRGQQPKHATVKLLTERMIDKMSNASRLVDKLEKKGFVKREQSEVDRRQVDISITQEGLVLLEKASQVVETGLRFTDNTLTEKEANTLNQLLDKIRESF